MKRLNAFAVTCGASLLASSAFAEPFTYQGQLNDAGEPANGEYDLVFRLFDAETDGTQLGVQVVPKTRKSRTASSPSSSTSETASS